MNPSASAGRQHYGVTLAVLLTGALAYALSQTMVVPALPAIQQDLGTSTTTVTFVLTAYLLTASVATPIVGRLGDMFGKERVLVATLVVFGVGSQDERGKVLENRARAVRHLGASPDRLATPYQVHGIKCVSVEHAWEAGKGPKADAVATTWPGVVVGVGTADCGPVLFAEPEARVVAAAHAGWKGAFAGVLESTVAAMERLGARRERIAASRVASDTHSTSAAPRASRAGRASRCQRKWPRPMAGGCTASAEITSFRRRSIRA